MAFPKGLHSFHEWAIELNGERLGKVSIHHKRESVILHTLSAAQHWMGLSASCAWSSPFSISASFSCSKFCSVQFANVYYACSQNGNAWPGRFAFKGKLECNCLASSLLVIVLVRQTFKSNIHCRHTHMCFECLAATVPSVCQSSKCVCAINKQNAKVVSLGVHRRGKRWQLRFLSITDKTEQVKGTHSLLCINSE